MLLADWIARGARVEGAGSLASAWSRAELESRVAICAGSLARHLRARTVVGLIADNCPQWIAIDLAAQSADMIVVPCPGFFTPEQLAHAIGACGMQALFCADAGLAASLGFADEVFDFDGLRLFRARSRAQRIPDARDAQKVTFTSGSTGEPKGVVLSTAQQVCTAHGLASAIAALDISRHLCALPLPVLLENVAGAYTALTIGAACICPPLAEVGMRGSSAFDAEGCLDAIARYAPDSLIVLPQMLQLLVQRLASSPGGDARIRSLKFVAVGGAKTPSPLIVRARELGLPVYEGYGLTECASVVSLNVPGADRVGTVGRPLPGVSVRAAPDGELEIAGRPSAAYLDSVTSGHEPWLRTGDLGAIDADGYVSITGRRKNVLVTSFGRNVSPEWPESLLLENPLLAQAAVFGEARPALVAVLVPASPNTDDRALEALVAAANARLPDYARIRDWIRAAEPFTAGNGLATANGRVRRDAIALRYARELDALYARTRIAS